MYLSGGRIHTEAQVPRRNHVTREHVVLGSNGCNGYYDKTCVIYSMVYFYTNIEVSIFVSPMKTVSTSCETRSTTDRHQEVNSETTPPAMDRLGLCPLSNYFSGDVTFKDSFLTIQFFMVLNND